MRSQIDVKWHGRNIPVELTEEQIDTLTVGELKEKCHRFTGLPVDHMKLLAYGAVMKDNSLPLSQYGVKPGTKLRLMGTKHHHDHDHHYHDQDVGLAASPTSLGQEHATEEVGRIQRKLNGTYVPDISEYEQQVVAYHSSQNGGEKTKETLFTKGLFFAEMLMQILFEFDGVYCENDKSRQLRKEGVKLAQGLLDKVDRLRNSVK